MAPFRYHRSTMAGHYPNLWESFVPDAAFAKPSLSQVVDQIGHRTDHS
jgi:hypothetical protein